MTKLNRVTGKVFGGDATATGDNPEIGQFGSALAGTYNGTTDVATIQNLPAWGQGWAGAVTPDTNFPALPEMTGFGKVLSYQDNYLLQSGMPEWDSGTIYYTNNFCRIGNVFYYSLTDENQGNDPTTDTTNWASYNNRYAYTDLTNVSPDITTIPPTKLYNFDGEYIWTDIAPLQDVNITSTGTSTSRAVDISGILPDDGFDYNVLTTYNITNLVAGTLKVEITNLNTQYWLAFFVFPSVTVAASTVTQIIRIPSGKEIVNLSFFGADSSKGINCRNTLHIYGYRRIGTNT